METPKRNFTLAGSALYLGILTCASVCIAVSLAIPFIHYKSEYASSQDRQRAREIASVCTAAQAAGFDPVDYSGLETTIRNVVRGGRINDRLFFVPGMTESDIPRVARHLRLVGGKLVYAPAGAPIGMLASSQN